MCDHKNLKTIDNRLFCKDCGQELPIEFLTKEPKKKTTKKGKKDDTGDH